MDHYDCFLLKRKIRSVTRRVPKRRIHSAGPVFGNCFVNDGALFIAISEETSVFGFTDDEDRGESVPCGDPMDGAVVVVFVFTSPVSWAFFNASFMEIVGSFLESEDSGERGREEGAMAPVPFISSV